MKPGEATTPRLTALSSRCATQRCRARRPGNLGRLQRDGPARFLANFTGYLQADAFSGYDAIYAGSDGKIREVACWAHARRKFFDARLSAPAEASLVLQMIWRLYKVEDRVRPLDDDARRAMRQTEAVPILERLREELDRLSSKLLPKSALCKR